MPKLTLVVELAKNDEEFVRVFQLNGQSIPGWFSSAIEDGVFAAAYVGYLIALDRYHELNHVV